MVEVVIGQFDHIDRLLDALRQVGIRTAVQLLHYRVIVDQFLQNGFPVNRLLGLFTLVLELPAFPPVQRSPADREISLFSQLAVRLFLQDGQPLHRLFLVLHKGFSSPGPLRGIKTEIDREVPFRIFIGYTDKGIACCLHDIEEFSHTVFLTVMDELHIAIQYRHRTQRNQDERVLVALEAKLIPFDAGGVAIIAAVIGHAPHLHPVIQHRRDAHLVQVDTDIEGPGNMFVRGHSGIEFEGAERGHILVLNCFHRLFPLPLIDEVEPDLPVLVHRIFCRHNPDARHRLDVNRPAVSQRAVDRLRRFFRFATEPFYAIVRQNRDSGNHSQGKQHFPAFSFIRFHIINHVIIVICAHPVNDNTPFSLYLGGTILR